MTEAEIMEQINTKKAELENYRSNDSSGNTDLIKKTEDEIKQLESSLTTVQTPPRRRRSAFLDECAG